ncbi:MAG: hypothetical protein ACYTFY_08920 [Planctomycetota bacterium]|jgi:hypothetical protein
MKKHITIATVALISVIALLNLPEKDDKKVAQTAPIPEENQKGVPAEKVPAKPLEKFRLDIVEPKYRGFIPKDCPVSVGVVFPERKFKKGMTGSLTDDTGKEIPFESEVTGWWNASKTEIKWLLLHFRADADKTYYFAREGKALRPEGPPLAHHDAPDKIFIKTKKVDAYISRTEPNVFDKLWIMGKEVLSKPEIPQSLILLKDGQEVICKIKLAGIEVITNTPERAVIKSTSFFEDPEGNKAALIELTYKFYRNEPTVKLFHTMTWMMKDWKVGARRISLGFNSPFKENGTFSLGLSENNDTVHDINLAEKENIYFLQESAEKYSLQADGKEEKTGTQFGNWISLKNKDIELGVSIRDAWQMYPKGISLNKGKLELELWPSKGAPMGLSYKDIMPEPLYSDPQWKRYPWSKEEGHMIPEYGGKKNPYWVYTAEGASRTHEITFTLIDKDIKRKAWQDNNMAHHPVIARQDPKEAMKVPFMGLKLSAADKEQYPNIERAIDIVGRQNSARFKELYSYGFWRYGFTLFNVPGGSLYRWNCGLQYDQQIIPWLLFLRGGDRYFFEEGEKLGRYGMDVLTNHYNTRGYPSGYQSKASATPFPFDPMMLHKGTKIHFMKYYYHLTGYKRSGEVMNEVIKGAKWHAKNSLRDSSHTHYTNRGREHYNISRLWANAYEETFDPEIKQHAELWLKVTADREYSPEAKSFRSPTIYLYDGIIPSQRLLNNEKTNEIIPEHINALGYLGFPDGGIKYTEGAIGTNWLYHKTKEKRYAVSAFELARSLADCVGAHDTSSPLPDKIEIVGVMMFKNYIMPMINGIALAEEENLENGKPSLFKDTYIGFNSNDQSEGKPAAFIKADKDGDLTFRLYLKNRFNSPLSDMKLKIKDSSDKTVLNQELKARKRVIVDRFVPVTFALNRYEITIKNAAKDQIYSLTLSNITDRLCMLILSEAKHVIKNRLNSFTDTQCHAGQYYSGGRIFTRTTKDEVKIRLNHPYPIAIRDADTWEEIYRSPLDLEMDITVRTGKGRNIVILTRGRSTVMNIQDGVEPYYSNRKEAWFKPEDTF